MFVYDKVFRPNATQEGVYNVVAKPIVKGKVTYIIVCHSVLVLFCKYSLSFTYCYAQSLSGGRIQ